MGYVQAVRDTLPGTAALPALLADMGKLNYAGANDIERFLAEAYELIDRIESCWFYSGEIVAGGF